MAEAATVAEAAIVAVVVFAVAVAQILSAHRVSPTCFLL